MAVADDVHSMHELLLELVRGEQETSEAMSAAELQRVVATLNAAERARTDGVHSHLDRIDDHLAAGFDHMLSTLADKDDVSEILLCIKGMRGRFVEVLEAFARAAPREASATLDDYLGRVARETRSLLIERFRIGDRGIENPALERRLLGETYVQLFLTELAAVTGILQGGDRDDARWSFWHRTLREALVAQRFAALVRTEAGRREVLARTRGLAGHEALWAEPFALFVGLTDEGERDGWLLELAEQNHGLALRALASVDGCRSRPSACARAALARDSAENGVGWAGAGRWEPVCASSSSRFATPPPSAASTSAPCRSSRGTSRSSRSASTSSPSTTSPTSSAC